jgi:hypothetical protein
VETELDLGDYSEIIRVKRDLTLCELLRRRHPLCLLISIYLLFLLKFVFALSLV